MQKVIWIFLLMPMLPHQGLGQQIPLTDAVRIREFYRLRLQFEDQIWVGWSQTPAPLLLVTEQGEFLTHHPLPPSDFRRISGDFYWRQRFFSTNLLATFPAFGPPSVIVIGEAESTSARTSTPWLITLMHEHFHQLQNAQPGYYQGVEELGLARGEKSGMWMLNFPFPYGEQSTVEAFDRLRDLLLIAVAESDLHNSRKLARQYVEARKQFFAQLPSDDHKYLDFQLWQEGIARYMQIKVAKLAGGFQPTREYAALPDYESFAHYAAHGRRDTLEELRRRAAEGLLLDRLNPGWQRKYFKHPFSLDSSFEN
jgi:hypothetical protein